MPCSQVELLRLWDDLCIPHKECKQVSSSPLTIIDLDVDPNTMTITLSNDAHNDLINELVVWTRHPQSRSDPVKFRLRHWQMLAGWLNWSFNVYPTLCPALNHVYPKMTGHPSPFSQIYVNAGVHFNLEWALGHICSLPGT